MKSRRKATAVRVNREFGEIAHSGIQDDGGCRISIPHFSVVEALAIARPDFLLVDGEHALIEVGDLAPLMIAGENRDVPLIFRVRGNRPELIKPALDLGVAAVMVPMVGNVTDAKAAVDAIKYPPEGRRGLGPLRASNYYQEYDAHVGSANDRVVSILQIETLERVQNIDAITAVPGVYVIYLGPSDLAASLKGTDVTFEAALWKVVKAAKTNGLNLGIDVGALSDLKRYSDFGFKLMTFGSDIGFIIDQAKKSSTEIVEVLRGDLSPSMSDR